MDMNVEHGLLTMCALDVLDMITTHIDKRTVWSNNCVGVKRHPGQNEAEFN
jgi:hypothetical protein